MDVPPYCIKKAVTRSQEDNETVSPLQEKTVRFDIAGVQNYTSPLICIMNMPHLCVPEEAPLPQLRGTVRSLIRNPEQIAAHQDETDNLAFSGYVVNLRPGQVEKSDEASEARFIPLSPNY